MSNKFKIEAIDDLNIWQESIEETYQYTMFVSQTYLKSFGGKYKTFFVKKGLEVKAGFCILLSDDEQAVVLDDLVIYSGIFFKYEMTQKEVKAKTERFEITELIIGFLTARFKNINMALSPQIEDMRPFLWHNYGSKDKKEIFELDLRYTSYVDISELENFNYEEETQVFKNLETLRQRNIRQARKDNSSTIEELNIDLFLEYYVTLMNNQNENVSKSKLGNMANIIKNTVAAKEAIMFTTKNGEGKVLYLTVFTLDKYRAYYLFGAGNQEATEHYTGTICFWDAFINLAQNFNIKEVDMEGINSPSRGWFKLGFGGSIQSYYEVKLGK